MRTTNKKVIRKLEQHVLENFWPDNYGSGTVGLQNLVDQIDSMMRSNPSYQSIYQTALDYVEGGSYLVYYGEVREFLDNLLENSPQESMHYTDEKAWKLYCHLIARTMSQLYAERQNQLKKEWEQSA